MDEDPLPPGYAEPPSTCPYNAPQQRASGWGFCVSGLLKTLNGPHTLGTVRGFQVLVCLCLRVCEQEDSYELHGGIIGNAPLKSTAEGALQGFGAERRLRSKGFQGVCRWV